MEKDEEWCALKRLRLFFWLWSMTAVMRASWGEGCSEAEKASLLMIRDSINNPNGGALTQWVRQPSYMDKNASNDCCTWPGVYCSPDRTVARINVANERKPELGAWFPNVTLFASFSQLTTLELDGNQVAGWSSSQAFSRLQRLQTLSLEDNRLTNSALVLQDLCMLGGLRELNLGRNQLNDSQIPLCLAKISSLQTLDLHGNNLTNPVAIKGLCGLESLQELDLSENQLVEASIPPCFANLTKVTYLDVSNNNFRGKIPSDILGRLHLLESLDLSYNEFSDSIPSFLANQSKLTYLNLSHNSLTDSIPGWLFNDNIQYLSLSNNQFNGWFPIPSNPSQSLSELDISNNQIEGIIPPDFTDLFPNLKNFSMSTNFLEGNILPTFCNNNLTSLDLSNNMFSGELPYKLFLECNNLEVIKLSNNRLQGAKDPYDLVPSLHPSLHTLDIGNNNFSGGMGSWLESVPNLQVLLMRHNSFEGQVPDQLCQIQSLRIVDVSHNKLTGQIPPCLYNITSWVIQIDGVRDEEEDERGRAWLRGESEELTTKGGQRPYSGTPLSMITMLDLSVNSLDGHIPPELGKLGRLHSLNLSSNDLSGPIPSDFQFLQGLESLDLSHNHLTGMIPPELSRLDSLESLSVAENNLSGRIPQGGQFDTFEQDVYTGNHHLCGKPLEEASCVSKGEGGTGNHPSRARESLADFDIVLYACILSSFILGFWGFMAPLYLCESWRHNYFQAVDTFLDFCYYNLLEFMNRNGRRLRAAEELGFQMTATGRGAAK